MMSSTWIEALSKPAWNISNSRRSPAFVGSKPGTNFVFDEPVGDDLINDGGVTGNELQVEPAQ